MKKKIYKGAIIYIRVSSDEQIKGHSLEYQVDSLKKYCSNNGIPVAKVFSEDFTGKHFNRPTYKLVKEFIKKNKGVADLFLITNWSRYGRNMTDSLQEIKFLNSYGYDIQAAEQPLDLSIPENKLMLAIYLAQPEVQNLRHTDNVNKGYQTALRAGRWPYMLPKGFKRIQDSEGKANIAPCEKLAPLVYETFTEFAKGIWSVEKLRLHMEKKGLKMKKTQFHLMLRQSVYAGLIKVPKFNDMPETVIKGCFVPIITLDVFQQVQDILEGRRREIPKRYSKHDELPLRGHLICPSCGQKMTGSASKGRNRHYYYYHCQPAFGCKTRFDAQKANEAFVKLLSKIKACSNVADLYLNLLQNYFTGEDSGTKQQIAKMNAEIEQYNLRIENMGIMLADGKLSPDDFVMVKNTCQKKILELETEKAKLDFYSSNYAKYLSWDLKIVKNIDKHYVEAPLETKQLLIGSIFPEKLIFENFEYRTTKVNEVVGLLFNNTAGWGDLKDEKPGKFAELSGSVGATGFEPVTLCL
jgi:site-specific DNA recombinase